MLRLWALKSSVSVLRGIDVCDLLLIFFAVFPSVSCFAIAHAIRAAMKSLKMTGSDFSSAKGMEPKSFFELMGNTFAGLD